MKRQTSWVIIAVLISESLALGGLAQAEAAPKVGNKGRTSLSGCQGNRSVVRRNIREPLTPIQAQINEATLTVPGAIESSQTNSTTGSSSESEDASIPVQELLGTWWTKGNESKVTIQPLQKGDNQHLSLVAKHDDWAGGYYDGILVFHRSPKFDEMSNKAPEWARKAVENKLRWTLELKPQSRCDEDLTLKGNWYPGELQWSEEKDASGKIVRKAWVVETKKGTYSRGQAHPVEYTKGETSFTLDLEDRADLVVWPYHDRSLADYYSPNPTLNSVSKAQPFTIVARMPIEMAERIGPTFSVSLLSAKTGNTTSVRLERFSGLGGTAIYSLHQPLRIADAGSGVGQLSLKAENEDSITVSAKNSSPVGFTVYNSPLRQGMAAQEEAFQALLATYNVVILEAKEPKVREGAHRQIVLINNARHLINDYQPTSLPALYVDLAGKTQSWDKITDYTRFFIAKRYLAMLEEKIDPNNEVDSQYGRKIALPPEVRDQYFGLLGITLTSVREWDELRHAFDEGKQAYANSFWADFIPQFSMGLYRVAVGTFQALKTFNPVLSKIEDVTILVYGVDILGEPVDKTQKIFAAIDLFAPLAVRTATYLSKLEAFDRALSTPLALRFRGKAESVSGPPCCIPHEPTLIDPNATFYAGNAVKIERPLEEVKTLIQSRKDTCSLMVLSAILRKAGFPRYGEEAMIGVAQNIKVKVSGKLEPLYRLGRGTYVDGTPLLLAEWGIHSTVVPANLKAIEVALQKGMGVSVSAKRHALLIQKILRLDDGKKWVFFEDPWNGNLWRMLADDFCQLYDKSYVLIVDYSGKFGKGPVVPI
jgi:hypothetical protein